MGGEGGREGGGREGPCPALPCRARGRSGCRPALSAEVVATAAPVDPAPHGAFRPAAAEIKFGAHRIRDRAGSAASLCPARPGSCPSRRRRFPCPPLRQPLRGRTAPGAGGERWVSGAAAAHPV